jgi:hypothetical protein
MPLSSVVGAQSIIKPGVCTSSTRPASPFEGQMIYETDTDTLLVYNGSAWVCITPKSSTQDASVNNPSGTAFAASAGSDPTVTVQTGTKALVTISARISSAGNYHFVGCAVSGATTVAAADANSATIGAISTATMSSVTYLLTGLTAGSNIFTMQYRCNVSASGSYDFRKLTVVGIP